MLYTFNIIENTDENMQKTYQIFDSFDTFLGSFNDVNLAYDLINTYLKYLKKIYSASAFSNVEKQIKEVSSRKKMLKNENQDEFNHLDEMVNSLFLSKKINNEKTLISDKKSVFSTSPISLKNNFTYLFDERSITEIHIESLRDVISNEHTNQNHSVQNLRDSLSKILKENEIAIYFPSIFNNGSDSEFIESKSKKKNTI